MSESKPLSNFYNRILNQQQISEALSVIYGGRATEIIELMKKGEQLPPDAMDAPEIVEDTVRLLSKEIGSIDAFDSVSDSGYFQVKLRAFGTLYFINAPASHVLGYFGSQTAVRKCARSTYQSDIDAFKKEQRRINNQSRKGKS